MKLTRRHILLASLATGVTATGSRKQLLHQAEQKRQAELEQLAQAKLSQKDAHALLEQWFGADDRKIEAGLKIQQSVKLTPPKIPYNREISKLLVQCCRLGTQQYLMSRLNPTYDGAINALPAYSHKLDGYTLTAAIQGLEDQEIEEDVEIELPANASPPDPLEDNLHTTEKSLEKTINQVVKIKKQIPVYFGFVLTSKHNHIITFRGTQRTIEWIQNVLLFQKNYTVPGYGKVHSGFGRVYDAIAQQTREIAQKLDPALPCYVTGHSLGGALAILAAMDLALKLPQLQPRLQLYTYATPRVGDPTFATRHSQLIPNSYRVVNLADAIPLAPPTTFRNQEFIHVGQTWSFLANGEDVLPNHAVDTYRAAVLREVETNTTRAYPISGLT